MCNKNQNCPKIISFVVTDGRTSSEPARVGTFFTFEITGGPEAYPVLPGQVSEQGLSQEGRYHHSAHSYREAVISPGLIGWGSRCTIENSGLKVGSGI